MSGDGYAVALAEARAGYEAGGIPIGSAIVDNRGEIVGRGHNERVQMADPTAHAEMMALRHAGIGIDMGRATVFTTLTPCWMCAGMIALFGVPRVVIGEVETYAGEGSLDFLRDRGVTVTILEDRQARELLAAFIADNPEVWRGDIGGMSNDLDA